jgi:hypothetical protein
MELELIKLLTSGVLFFSGRFKLLGGGAGMAWPPGTVEQVNTKIMQFFHLLTYLKRLGHRMNIFFDGLSN